MNEGALTEAAVQAGLRDIRLPAEAAGGVLAEIAAVIAVAALLALMFVALWRWIGVRGRRGRKGEDLAALAEMAPEARRVALLHLLKQRAPERFERYRGALYRPSPDGAEIDLTALEAEVRRYG